MKTRIILLLQLIGSMVYQVVYYDPDRVTDYKYVKYDPFPFADVMYFTRQHHIYNIMEHVAIILPAFLLWHYKRYSILLVYLVIQCLDLVDYLLCYNRPWFNYNSMSLTIPVSFNVVSFIVYVFFMFSLTIDSDG